MLSIKQLCYQNILKSLDFTARRGEFIGIVGPNGSGKTTLLKCLAGIFRDFSGRIILDRQDTGLLSSREIARLVSYVPQIMETVIPFTVIEFLRLSRFPYFGMSARGGGAPDFDVPLQQMGVVHLKNRRVSSLSGGELQRVLVAAALVQETPIVLLDEPTSHLDPFRAGEFVDTLAFLKNQGKRLFLMVSHNAEEITALCDRVIALKDGKKIGEFDSEFLLKTESLPLIYGDRGDKE